MTVSIERARDFVYQNGTPWERALFAYLFENGSRQRVWQCLGAYQNADGGWAHGLEHDIRTPSSNPATTEYALGVILDFGLAEAEPLQRTARWVEITQHGDGTLPWPADLHTYPRMPWWGPEVFGGRPWPPDALVGRLAALGYASPSVLHRTQQWVNTNLKADTFAEEMQKGYEAVYSLYHYADYFLGARRALPPQEAQIWSERIARALLTMAQDPQEVAAGDLLTWLQRYPEPLKPLIPQAEVERHLDALQAGQQENGAWLDRHNLLQWQPIQTIWALKALRDWGRI